MCGDARIIACALRRHAASTCVAASTRGSINTGTDADDAGDETDVDDDEDDDDDDDNDDDDESRPEAAANDSALAVAAARTCDGTGSAGAGI